MLPSRVRGLDRLRADDAGLGAAVAQTSLPRRRLSGPLLPSVAANPWRSPPAPPCCRPCAPLVRGPACTGGNSPATEAAQNLSLLPNRRGARQANHCREYFPNARCHIQSPQDRRHPRATAGRRQQQTRCRTGDPCHPPALSILTFFLSRHFAPSISRFPESFSGIVPSYDNASVRSSPLWCLTPILHQQAQGFLIPECSGRAPISRFCQ